MRTRIKIRALIGFITVISLYLSLLPTIPFSSYLDDIIPLIYLMAFLLSLRKGINRNSLEKRIFIIIAFVCSIGVISNFVSAINTNITDIVTDMYSFLKMFIVFLGVKALFKGHEKSLDSFVGMTANFCRIFIAIGLVFGVLNLAGIVSMSETMRYGFGTYAFIYGNASQYGILVGVALAFVIFDNPKHRIWYEISGLITLIMTLKGMSLIIVTVYISLILLRTKKIKLWHIILVGGVLLFILSFQISGYLMDSTAPRAILIRYGAITANKYFPFGSGFGTYGSDVAARHYSPLYLQYGFTSRNALVYGERTALNDAYLGMIMGQFGWLGTALMIYAFYLIGRQLIKLKTTQSNAYYISLALYVCMMGMAVMAGSLKVTAGPLILMVVQIYMIKMIIY